MTTVRRCGGRTVRALLGLLSVLPSFRLIAQSEGSVLTALPGSTRPAVTDESRFTFGGGVVLGRLALDYAFQAYDVLGGGTHRVGLRWTP